MKVEDYNKRLKATNDFAYQEPTKQKSTNNNDYYELARQQEYGTLFDKEVELENAKQNALKYTQNQINAQGFGGTGYGSSIQSGIYNTYLNKVGNAQSEYNQNIKDINASEQADIDAKANDRFQSVTTMLTQASTQEQMDNLLSQYGYGTVDNGTFTWNEKPEGMSEDDWYQMQYYYNLQKDAIAQGADTTAYYNSLDSLNNMTFIGANGTAETFNSRFREEANTLWHYAQNGTYANGDAVKVANKNGNIVYLEWTKNGFKQISEEQYKANSNKWEVVNQGSGSSQKIYNNRV